MRCPTCGALLEQDDPPPARELDVGDRVRLAEAGYDVPAGSRGVIVAAVGDRFAVLWDTGDQSYPFWRHHLGEAP